MANSRKDIKHFIKFAANQLQLPNVPHIEFVGKEENAKNAFGHYVSTPETDHIAVRVTERHPIDVMRTIAHELIHYKQKLSGSKAKEKMREDEANAIAGRVMREYDTTFPKSFYDKPISEEVGVGAIGGGVAANHTGQDIATFDPKLIIKKKKSLGDILKRKPLEEAGGGGDKFHKKKLNLGMKPNEGTKQPMKKKFGIGGGQTDFNKMMKDEGEEEKDDYKMPTRHGRIKITVGQ